jgi:pSer/pThr/pTyr-binding forkhead associated (FHA) protein
MNTIVLDDHNPTIVNTQPERYPTRHHHVLIVTIDNIVEHIPVTQTLITIGRAPGNNIILQDHQVSRHHAKISYNAQRFAITDLASRNGTFVNGDQLTNEPHIIDIDQDVISISNYTLRFEMVNDE